MPPTVTKQNNKPAPPRPVQKPAPGKSAWDMVDALHVLVYGVSGSGKTTFASTFPAPILWLVCSGGNKPGELRSIKTKENMERITPVVLESSEHLRQMVTEDAPAYATVVLDHATGFADMVLGEIIGKPVPVQKGWGLASQQQYGQLSLVLKTQFRELLNLPGNVVIISQERVFGGKDDGGDPDLIKPTVGAALTPSVTGWLTPACDYVVQTFKRPRMENQTTKIAGKEVTTTVRGKGVEYCLRTEPHDIYQTKFRIPRGLELPECIVDPDYQKMVAVINGEYEE